MCHTHTLDYLYLRPSGRFDSLTSCQAQMKRYWICLCTRLFGGFNYNALTESAKQGEKKRTECCEPLSPTYLYPFSQHIIYICARIFHFARKTIGETIVKDREKKSDMETGSFRFHSGKCINEQLLIWISKFNR